MCLVGGAHTQNFKLIFQYTKCTCHPSPHTQHIQTCDPLHTHHECQSVNIEVHFIGVAMTHKVSIPSHIRILNSCLYGTKTYNFSSHFSQLFFFTMVKIHIFNAQIIKYARLINESLPQGWICGEKWKELGKCLPPVVWTCVSTLHTMILSQYKIYYYTY